MKLNNREKKFTFGICILCMGTGALTATLTNGFDKYSTIGIFLLTGIPGMIIGFGAMMVAKALRLKD
jgi:hypothetical protein